MTNCGATGMDKARLKGGVMRRRRRERHFIDYWRKKRGLSIPPL